PYQCRHSSTSRRAAAVGTKRRATVRGEACEKLERTAAESEPTGSSAQVGVGGNGKRPGVDHRAPGVRIDAAKRQRPTTGLNKSTRSGHDSRKRSACVVAPGCQRRDAERYGADTGERTESLAEAVEVEGGA